MALGDGKHFKANVDVLMAIDAVANESRRPVTASNRED